MQTEAEWNLISFGHGIFQDFQLTPFITQNNSAIQGRLQTPYR